MSRVCAVMEKRPMSGHNVSHANNRTKRRFLPNLQNVTFQSDILKKNVRLRISTHGLRTIEHNGGFDAYLQNKPITRLSPTMQKYKKQIRKALKKEAA